MSERRDLNFKSEADVIADVQALRRGHRQLGNWSFEQIAWHLELTTRMRMKPGPFPADSPEQIARRPMFEEVLRSGILPTGLIAPDGLSPPADANATSIDGLIAALQEFRAFAGPFAPHRLFGHLSSIEARQINLIHCANHLSWLVPA